MTKINIMIDKKGNVLIETSGYEGSACYKDMKKLQSVLKGAGINFEIEEVLKEKYEVLEVDTETTETTE